MKSKFTLTLWGIIFTLSSAFATNHIISFGSHYYNPSNFTVTVGDTIMWQGDFAMHPLSTAALPSGAMAITHINYGTSYSYKVMVAGTYGFRCSSSSITGMDGTFTARAITGVEEPTAKPALLFEFSTLGRTLKISNMSEETTAGYKVQISSILGAIVYEGQMSEREHIIDLQSYPESIYMLSISDETNNTFVRKFMLQ